MGHKMKALQVEDIGDHHLSLQVSHAWDDDPPVAPCIGSAHQAEIPNLATDDERLHLMASSLYSCKLHGYDYPSVSIPVAWGSHPPSQVIKKEDIASEGNSTYLDPHADQTDSASNQVFDETPVQCFTRERHGLFTGKAMVYQGETIFFSLLPGFSASLWTDLEEECFLLGLHIFGKNLSLVSKFIGSKTVGEMLSYYYGRFYNGPAYKRWSHLRKARITRCILGKSIFTGRRQHELISRLKLQISREAHDSIVQVLKSLSSDLTSLEKCVFTLKSTIGLKVFVEVIGIGKGKPDLTGFVQDTSKTNKGLSVSGKMSKGINCSMLATEDIVMILTGDFRISKAKLHDLFWDAVWPRLLARGWHSEQPKDIRTTKNGLVYLAPAIEKFSRKLTKGTHYFDSIRDVLKKVAADPTLLKLETDGTDNDAPVHTNGRATGQDDPLDGDSELPAMFTIIDTSLVQGEEPFKVRALRSLPADTNISCGTYNMLSDSSSKSQEQHSDGNLSDDQEYHGQVTTAVNDIEMGSVDSTTKESLVDLLEDVGTAAQSVFPVNGHCSDDKHSGISSGNGERADLACCSVLGTKTGRLVYLSPKRRRFARCSNEQSSQRILYVPDDDDLKKNKFIPLSISSKPSVVDVGGNFHAPTLAKCSTKGKPCQEVSNGRSLEKRNVENANENKSSEGNFDAVGRTSTVGGTWPEPDNHDCLQINEDVVVNRNEDKSPSISNKKIVVDVLETAAKQDVSVEASSRRHGTRNRPPTARALEAVAFGLLGGTKRKGDAKSLTTRRPPQRARKNND